VLCGMCYGKKINGDNGIEHRRRARLPAGRQEMCEVGKTSPF